MSDRLEQKMEAFDAKLDAIHMDLMEVKLTMAENTGSLKEHMARTKLAEENINMLRKEFAPVKAHVLFVNNISKFIAVVASILLFLKTMEII